MKKFAILIVVALLAISSAWAQGTGYPGDPANATANFTCNVIIPISLDCTNPTLNLPVVIQGTTRALTTANVINFTVGGSAGEDYILTLTGPTAYDGVTINGVWSVLNGTYTFGGTATPFTYTVNSIATTAGAVLGPKSFTIKAEADYTGL